MLRCVIEWAMLHAYIAGDMTPHDQVAHRKQAGACGGEAAHLLCWEILASNPAAVTLCWYLWFIFLMASRPTPWLFLLGKQGTFNSSMLILKALIILSSDRSPTDFLFTTLKQVSCPETLCDCLDVRWCYPLVTQGLMNPETWSRLQLWGNSQFPGCNCPRGQTRSPHCNTP